MLQQRNKRHPDTETRGANGFERWSIPGTNRAALRTDHPSRHSIMDHKRGRETPYGRRLTDRLTDRLTGRGMVSSWLLENYGERRPIHCFGEA